MAKILVCTPLSPSIISILEEAADIVHAPDIESANLAQQIADYDAIIVDDRLAIDGRLLEEGYQLRAIGRIGARLDNIDVSTARALGISVCYSPGGVTIAIAEQTCALMLSLAAMSESGLGLAGETLGLIGFGRISRQVARRARAFDMQVLVNQPRLTPELALAEGATVSDLPDMLSAADYVSLHVPLKPETAHIIDESALKTMKPGAQLINTAFSGLMDGDAVLKALNDGILSGVAISAGVAATLPELREHRNVIVAPPLRRQQPAGDQNAGAVIRQLLSALRAKRPSETLSLDVVPSELVVPHEQIDDKRVTRLQSRLAEEKVLVNPPLVTAWNGRYVVLDGATRTTALRRLGHPHMIVQLVDPGDDGFALHTWYHAISDGRPIEALLTHLRRETGIELAPLPISRIAHVFEDRRALCYFLGRNGDAFVAFAPDAVDRLSAMNELVAAYTAWGEVERTLLTDLGRLLGQFPRMTAVAIFPQFDAGTVFDVATRGELLPAGLTRFVIPGRILRLNADLDRLQQPEPLSAKRAWLNAFLADKLARSRLRYYQEPVILLDE